MTTYLLLPGTIVHVEGIPVEVKGTVQVETETKYGNLPRGMVDVESSRKGAEQ